MKGSVEKCCLWGRIDKKVVWCRFKKMWCIKWNYFEEGCVFEGVMVIMMGKYVRCLFKIYFELVVVIF